MDDGYITIDMDKLRNDMRNESLSGYFGGGFGGALIESFDIEGVSNEKLVEMAQSQGINLKNYQVL